MRPPAHPEHPDLEVFATARGLLDRIIVQGASELTDDERITLLELARDNLARFMDSDPKEAGHAMHEAAQHGDIEVRASDQFAVVAAWGRVLAVMTRAKLRGVCHPEQN